VSNNRDVGLESLRWDTLYSVNSRFSSTVKNFGLHLVCTLVSGVNFVKFSNKINIGYVLVEMQQRRIKILTSEQMCNIFQFLYLPFIVPHNDLL
jgi:hypothetical protein